MKRLAQLGLVKSAPGMAALDMNSAEDAVVNHTREVVPGMVICGMEVRHMTLLVNNLWAFVGRGGLSLWKSACLDVGGLIRGKLISILPAFGAGLRILSAMSLLETLWPCRTRAIAMAGSAMLRLTCE